MPFVDTSANFTIGIYIKLKNDLKAPANRIHFPY